MKNKLLSASIIIIGNEILLGKTIDSNSIYITKKLDSIGFKTKRIISIGDQINDIINALSFTHFSSEVVVLTGGLGPTSDDVTKAALLEYFDDYLTVHRPTLEHIKTKYQERNLQLNSKIIRLAKMPSKSRFLSNSVGIAPGLLIENNGVLFFALPGVPKEMKYILNNHVIKEIKQHYKPPNILHKSVFVYGISESTLSNKLKDWEKSLLEIISVAYLPSKSFIRMRLSIADYQSRENLITKLDIQVQQLQHILGTSLSLSKKSSYNVLIGQLLLNRNQKLAVAESCTGGYLSHVLTRVSGSSSYFLGGITTYTTKIKCSILGIKKSVIEEFTVVSKEVACSMAENVRLKFKSDWALATTGVAGPTKGEDNKEIGTIWVAIASKYETKSKMFYFRNLNRQKFIEKSSHQLLKWFYTEILN